MIFSFLSLSGLISSLLILFGLIILRLGIQIVPQSDVFVKERLGKYSRTLKAGLSLIIPFLDRVAWH
jgi:regulator of protease activity HflC (stomatin/prohibitin superfamily)